MDLMLRTILWSAPLSVVLFVAVVWVLRSWLIERLASSIRHEYAKDLAEHQAKLKAQFDAELEVRKAALKAQSDAELEVHKVLAQRWFHIDKAQFDMEFSSFQKLWGAVSLAVDKTYVVLRLHSYSETDKGKGERRRYATEADGAFFAAMAVSQELMPFIPLQVHERSTALITRCKAEIDHFFQYLRQTEDEGFSQESYEEAKERSGLAREFLPGEWRAVADAIRDRLDSFSGTLRTP